MWTINQNNELKDTKKTVENVHIKQELSVGLFLSVKPFKLNWHLSLW